MTIRLFLLSFLLIQLACTASVSDPKGAEPNGTGLSYRPVVSLFNFNGERSYKAGGSYPITFAVEDEVLGVNQSTIEYKKDSESEWVLIRDHVLSSSQQLISENWVLPTNLSGSDFRLRITAYGKKPGKTELISYAPFTIDNEPPTLEAGNLLIIEPSAANPFQFLKYLSVSGASDALTGVGGVCLNQVTASVLSEDDSCWIPTQTLSLSKIPFFAGFSASGSPIDQQVEVKDKAGNVRALTNVVGTDLLSYMQAVPVPTVAGAGNYLNLNLGLSKSNISSILAFANFPPLAANATDSHYFVYLPNGSLIVRDPLQGIIKIDLGSVEVDGSNNCLSGTCTSVLAGLATAAVDAQVGPLAKVIAPLKITLDPKGTLWILDKKANTGTDLVIRKIDFSKSPARLTTVMGGGTDTTSAEFKDPNKIKIVNSEALQFLGTFQGLPNGGLVFNSEDPESFLQTGAARYRLRIYNPSSPTAIKTISLDLGSGGAVLSEDFLATSTAAITFNSTADSIDSIYLRVCKTSVPKSYANSCSDTKTLSFNREGAWEASKLIANSDSFGNLYLFSNDGKNVYAVNGQSSDIKKFDLNSQTWSSLAGTSVRASAYCNNATLTSSCDLRLNDAYVDAASAMIFLMDHQKIRLVAPDSSRIYSLLE